MSNHAHKTYLVSHARHAHDVVLVALSTRTTTAGASTHVEHTACALIVERVFGVRKCGGEARARAGALYPSTDRPTDPCAVRFSWVRSRWSSSSCVRGVHGVRDDANTYATRRPRVNKSARNERTSDERRRPPARDHDDREKTHGMCQYCLPIRKGGVKAPPPSSPRFRLAWPASPAHRWVASMGVASMGRIDDARSIARGVHRGVASIARAVGWFRMSDACAWGRPTTTDRWRGSALRGAMSGAPSTSSAAMQAKLVRGRRWWWCRCGCGCGLVVG